MNVRDWLLEDKQDDNSHNESHTVNGGLCHSAEEVVAKARMSMEEKLKRAALGTVKMTKWLKQTPATNLEWDDDPDLPELDEIKDIKERELEKVQMEKGMTEGICSEVVVELVTMVEAVSMANNVMEQIIDRRGRA